jgi:hypothetical protein
MNEHEHPFLENVKKSKLGQALKKLMYWLEWDEIASNLCYESEFVMLAWKERVGKPDKISDLKRAMDYLEESTVMIAETDDGRLINEKGEEVVKNGI